MCKLAPTDRSIILDNKLNWSCTFFSMEEVLNSSWSLGITQENSRGSRRGDCGVTAIAASKGRTPPSGERALQGIWTNVTGRRENCLAI